MEDVGKAPIALTGTVNRLKSERWTERQSDVKAKIEANNEKLRKFTTHLIGLSSSRASKNTTLLDKDKLNALVERSIVDHANVQGPVSLTSIKRYTMPVVIPAVQKIPPYITWNFLDRNQRMAEDQSHVGRRRIYYDPSVNETLICSDSEEEQEEKEEKREFSKSDDVVICETVKEHGTNKAVWKAIGDGLKVKPVEIEARYEVLTKDTTGTPKHEEEKLDLQTNMDSFNHLFCRRCLVFDCRLHGCSQPLVIPSEKHIPLNSTGSLPSKACGSSCFHLSRLSGTIQADITAAPEGEPPRNVICLPNAVEESKVTTPKKRGLPWLFKMVAKRKNNQAFSSQTSKKQRTAEDGTSVSPTDTDPKPVEEDRKEVDGESKQLGSGIQKRLQAKTNWQRKIAKAGRVTSNWSKLEKDLVEKGIEIFGKDSCLIARNLLRGLRTCAEVGQFMVTGDRLIEENKRTMEVRARLLRRRKGRARRLKHTWSTVGYSKKVPGGNRRKQYNPCTCQQNCGKSCPCLKSGVTCEKYCGCWKTCKNRFRGCHCAKSQCSTRLCPCFAASRDCDPDVCRSCWIGWGEGSEASTELHYSCRNMKLLLKQHQRILLGRSDVVGWGAFLKDPVNKDEYLGEYTGELISQREAEWRGKIYDLENSSFLFDVNDEFVLDACRKGNKLKFANHSPNPNCYAKVIKVAGDHRVGIFAKKRMAAGEELFYDYGYKSDSKSTPAWALKPCDAARHGSANHTGRAQKTV